MTIREEITDLLGRNLSDKENRRMFAIYSELSGKAIRVCFCSGKVKRVRQYLEQWLKENEEI